MNFKNYEFKNYIKKAIEDLGFEEFTDVQLSVFDNLKTNKNILAKSRTGSGKTHAFLLPIFNDLEEDLNQVQATIIAPTKELSIQIYKVAQHIASFSPKAINIKLFSGGTDRLKEIDKLKGNTPQIVIGTPGKIKDLAIDENVLKVYTSKYFVVDEVDMTFESGFSNELDIIAATLKEAKMMFFSATLSEQVLPFIKKYMTNVEFIEIKNNTEAKI